MTSLSLLVMPSPVSRFTERDSKREPLFRGEQDAVRQVEANKQAGLPRGMRQPGRSRVMTARSNMSSARKGMLANLFFKHNTWHKASSRKRIHCEHFLDHVLYTACIYNACGSRQQYQACMVGHDVRRGLGEETVGGMPCACSGRALMTCD